MKIGLIYGSDTGDTEEISHRIKQKLKNFDVTLYEVSEVDENIILKFDFLIFGLSTWYDGDLQSDWEDYFEEFKKIDFRGKIVSFFGLGDQYGYDYNFVDGIGMLAVEVIKNNGKIIGLWPNKGYEFAESKALKDENTFYGLVIDQDNQYDLTDERIDVWSKDIIDYIKKTNKFKT